MVNFRKLTERAKQAVDAAGGPDAVKDKAAGLRDVARSKGSLSDKAKRAADVVREDERPAEAPASTPGAAAETPAQREQRRHRGGRRDEV